MLSSFLQRREPMPQNPGSVIFLFGPGPEFVELGLDLGALADDDQDEIRLRESAWPRRPWPTRRSRPGSAPGICRNNRSPGCRTPAGRRPWPCWRWFRASAGTGRGCNCASSRFPRRANPLPGLFQQVEDDVEHLADLVVFGVGGGREHSAGRPGLEAAAGAVGQAALDAELGAQPGGEPAAEERVHDRGRGVIASPRA